MVDPSLGERRWICGMQYAICNRNGVVYTIRCDYEKNYENVYDKLSLLHYVSYSLKSPKNLTFPPFFLPILEYLWLRRN